MAKYPPLFKRIPIDATTTGQDIAKVQADFESFWSKLIKLCPPNSERTMAMRKLQEASYWFTRAIAVNGFDPKLPTDGVIVVKVPEPNTSDLSPSKQQPATNVPVDMSTLVQQRKKLLKLNKHPEAKTDKS